MVFGLSVICKNNGPLVCPLLNCSNIAAAAAVVVVAVFVFVNVFVLLLLLLLFLFLLMSLFYIWSTAEITTEDSMLAKWK